MRKLFLLSVALTAALTLSAQSFNNVNGTFAWTVGNESDATVSEAVAGAVLETRVSVGADLNTGTKSDYAANNGHTMVTYQPSTSKPGSVAGVMIEYSVKMKKGITFTPTSFSYDAIKEGTNDASYSWSYTIDGTESTITDVSKDYFLRNDNSNSSTAQLNHVETIDNASSGRSVTFRIYVSGLANNKKAAFSNIQINGVVNGEEEVRSFQNFTLELRNQGAINNLPAGVTLLNNPVFNDAQHGYKFANFSVAVDGPVRFKIGGCTYSNTACTIYKGETLLATLSVNAAGCDNGAGTYEHFVTYVYNNEEPATLTINGAEYCPYIIAEACEYTPLCYVSYFDTDGTTLLGKDTVDGGSTLVYKFGASDVTVPQGYAFRGWFNSKSSTGTKVAQGITLQEDLVLYAKATPIEVVTSTARFVYDLTKAYFDPEDHEAITINGGYWHDAQHGWAFGNGGKIVLPVSKKALVTIGNCRYSNDTYALVTDLNNNLVDSFRVKAPDSADGEGHMIRYSGPETTLTVTFYGTTYVHGVKVYNVVNFVEYDEVTGYYVIPANDVNSFLLALTDACAAGNRKIFLPNGTYDLGEEALTTISGSNISIIGESMEGTIIRNAPLVENEGIGTTATLLNMSTGLYLQDLTLQNALDYYHSGSAGRAVCLQDKGLNTICKNVRMLSYQDTYYSNRAGAYYWEDGEIHGTVDYLCGDGNVVMNRMLFVNESRSATGKSGSDVLCAPNCTATTTARPNWGYVFLDCSVRSESNNFTFARSWGGESKAAFIRTTILDNSLANSRFTVEGMNKAAYEFKEFGTKDAEGNLICPSTNIINFTHSSGNKQYETILNTDEAAAYTVANIFGTWAPDQIAAQVQPTSITLNTAIGDLTWTGEAQVYLVKWNDEHLITTDKTLGNLPAGATISVRAANGRGGFGPAIYPEGQGSSMDQLNADEPVKKFFENGQVVILKDGVKYNALGTVIR